MIPIDLLLPGMTSVSRVEIITTFATASRRTSSVQTVTITALPLLEIHTDMTDMRLELPLLFAIHQVCTVRSTSRMSVIVTVGVASSPSELKHHHRFLQLILSSIGPYPHNPAEITIPNGITIATNGVKIESAAMDKFKAKAEVAIEVAKDQEWPPIVHSSKRNQSYIISLGFSKYASNDG